jgi:PAS domain S-box-containing protein
MEFVSEGSFNLTGYRPAELVNNSKITYNKLVHPDECEKVWDTIQAALKEHKPFQLTYRIKTADGEQKWVLEQGQGIFNPKGELLAIEGFVSDTTEKVQLQESIRESECFLSEVFASIQDGISVLDADLNIVRTNATMEKWYAHTMPLIGKKCYEVYHGRKTRCNACPACRTLGTGKADYEVVPKTGPGGKVVGWIDLYSFPLIDATTGKLKGVIEYVREITDANARRAAEKKLAESPKESADNEVHAVVTTSAT